MKKVALCLHGQPRGLGIAIDWQNKNIINRTDIDVDVFFHTWDYSDRLLGINNKIIDIYSPKKYVIEKPISKEISKKYQKPILGQFNAYSNYCHYHSLYNSDLLRREYEKFSGVVYDWVISTRFDVAINIILDFESMDSSKLYQSDFDIQIYMRNGYKVQNPVFTVGNGYNIKKYSDVLPNIDVLYDLSESIDGHSIFGANIRLQELVEVMMPLNMNHPFPPRGRDSSPNSFIRDDYDIFKDW